MIRLRHSEGLRRAIGALAFASYLLVLAMAASPELHQWLHGDADEADHQCAAVTAIHGQIDRPTAGPEVVASPALSWVEPRTALYAISIVPLFLLVSVLEHAPPIIG